MKGLPVRSTVRVHVCSQTHKDTALDRSKVCVAARKKEASF